MHRSKWKHRLTRDARRAFAGAGWKIREGMVAGGVEVDFFVLSPLANFEILSINQTARSFRSDTILLERIEEQSRHFRIRNGCAIHLVDSGIGSEFVRLAKERGILVIHIDEIDQVTSLSKYFSALPEVLLPLQLRVLESNFLACSNLCGRFKAAGEIGKAIEWARRAIKSRYGYSIQSTLFSLLLESGDLDGAEEVGKEGLSFKPNDAAIFFKGFQKIATLRGDHATAVGWAERWVAMEPLEPRELVLAYDNLAQLHEQHRNGPAAVLAIGQALRLSPGNPGILRRAARIALLDGNVVAALDYAERCVAQAPGDAGAHDLLADVLMRQKSYERAKTVIVEALALHPEHVGLLRRASIIALETGDFVVAAQFAERWVAAATSDAGAYDHASFVYLRAERYEEARLANAKALELDPLRPNIQRRAADIAARLARQTMPPPSVRA
jgi:tetratricopeptide (TPR) repeat protein